MPNKRDAAAMTQAKKLLAAEKKYEAEMNERIVTESALIRAEWCEALRDQRRVTKGQPLRLTERHVPEQWSKGIDFT